MSYHIISYHIYIYSGQTTPNTTMNYDMHIWYES